MNSLKIVKCSTFNITNIIDYSIRIPFIKAVSLACKLNSNMIPVCAQFKLATQNIFDYHLKV